MISKELLREVIKAPNVEILEFEYFNEDTNVHFLINMSFGDFRRFNVSELGGKIYDVAQLEGYTQVQLSIDLEDLKLS